MNKRKQNTIALKRENLINRLRILLIAALTIITFYPPYLQGLYFEKHVLPTQIIVFVTFIVFLIYKLLKKDYTFFRTPIDYACLGFVIVYFISIFVAVHTRSAIIEWLEYCMYFAVFYMVSDLAEDCKTKLLFIWTVIISAAGVAIIGLDAALGGNLVKVLNGLYNLLGGQGNFFFGLFVDNRIHSTLQYPNALASYLMAVFFITVGLIMFSKKWWQRIILGSITFTLFLTFMLTQSRGAQLLFPIAIILLLVTAPKGNKIKVVTNSILLAIPAVIISLSITPYLSDKTLNGKALLLLLIGLAINILMSLAIELIGNILQRVNWKVYVIFVSVFIITIFIGIYYVINSSVPVELSLLESQDDKLVSVSKDVSLKPNKEYILKFEAYGKMNKEQPYVFFVRLFNKNINDILFYRSKQILRVDFSETSGFEEFNIPFTTKEDTKIINISFSVYRSGTAVIINNASIIDANTGKMVKKLVLKNKYNLDNTISRFQNFWLQNSMLSRAIFYKDGLNMLKDRLILGGGGGAWNYLYRQYQSYNYTSSQAHNYPLQLGIETGILGLLILFYLVLILFMYYIKYYKKDKNHVIYATIYSSILLLLLHSVIDFDFAESSMLILFWLLIALFNGNLIEKFRPEELITAFAKKKPKVNRFDANRKPKYLILVALIVTVSALYYTSRFFIASSLAKQAFRSFQNNNTETAINKMEKAINLDKYNETYVIGYTPVPTRPDIRTGLIDILLIKNDVYVELENEGQVISENEKINLQKQFEKAISYLNNIERMYKNNLNFSSALASFYLKTGEKDKGIFYLDEAIRCFPFEKSLWHAKIEIYYQLMKDCFNNKEYDEAKGFLLKGLSVINEAKIANMKNMNPFIFNDNTVQLLQTMKYMLDNWNTDEIFKVNEIVFYSIFDLDVNMDGIPDQWAITDSNRLKINIRNENLYIQSAGRDYLYTYYPISLTKGYKYRIELYFNDLIENVTVYVPGITQNSIPFTVEGDKHVAELTIEEKSSNDKNQFRIYIENDCVINKILVKKLVLN